MTRKQIKTYNDKLYAQFRIYIDKLKKTPCTDCGHKFPPECMDFDHVRGRKKFNIGCGVRYSRVILEREIAKCDLICSNCHRIRTRRRRK